MTREELLALVNKELGGTKLTLNERTINEELDDSLGDFGEDEAANAKTVTRIAKRLKRMDGNVHAVVSHEVEEYKKNYKPKTDKTDTRQGGESEEDEKIPKWARQLMEDVKAEKAARQAEKAERDKKNLLESVKRGLEAKFKDADMESNRFFVRSALSKLQIPEKDADVRTLVDEAEKIYNADLKEAGFTPDSPRSGNKGRSAERIDEHEWDDVKKIVSRGTPKPEK